jgi:thiamine monophosphate kinase
LDEVQQLARALGRGVRVIGEVQEGEAVVEYVNSSGKKALERRGWIHLANR